MNDTGYAFPTSFRMNENIDNIDNTMSCKI